VGNLQTKLRIGFPNLLCNLQTKLRIGLPNISAINLKQNFELGFQIYVQNLKSGLPNLSKANTNPRIKMKRKEKTKTKTKTLIQALNFQNHKHQNHQTQKQNFSFESFNPSFKMQTKKLKKTGYQICSSKKDNTSFPHPPKEIKFKENRNENSIPTLLQHFTSNPSKISTPKKQKPKENFHQIPMEAKQNPKHRVQNAI